MKKYSIIFSPTGGTLKVANAITSKWDDVETIDLSDNDFSARAVEEDAFALIAMPSFGGVAPQLALDRLAKIKASNTKCAIVAVYGNRAYDDTLIQMKDYAEKSGFTVIAAISAVAEHSIVHDYASGRPDANDRRMLSAYGEQIIEKANTESTGISVPGNRPYKKAGAAMCPKATSACNSCGLCAKNCPSGAIDKKNLRISDKSKCIGCMRCVSICPQKARKVNPIMTKIAALAIKKACSEAKPNELII